MKELEISVIIRTYNEEKHIGKLLVEISQQQISGGLEVIIVDSGSQDETIDIARNFDTKIISITPEEFTFGYSLNRGIEKAAGDICVIVSAHCHPFDDLWLKSLVAPFYDDKVMMTYGKQRGGEDTKFSEHRLLGKWFGEETILDNQVPFANNANSAIRRSFWTDYKFNEIITGFEDLDWARQVQHEGFKIDYISEAGVFHIHDEPWGVVYQRYFREAYAYKEIYPNEHFTLSEFLHVLAFSVLEDCYAALKQNQLIKSLLEIVKFRSIQFLATYRAYRLQGSPVSVLKRKLYYPTTAKFRMVSRGQKK